MLEQNSANLVNPQKITPDVYAFIGTGGEINTANIGRIGNSGFIIGEKGVLVIDAGVSEPHGEALLAAIAKTTDKPIRALFVTHAMQEFLFGATAFQKVGAQMWMHPLSVNTMKQRCNNCLKNLNTHLGAGVMKNTLLPTPDKLIEDVTKASQALSTLIGRPIQLLHYGTSSGPGDVALWDATSRTLFSGAMVESQRLPDTHDAPNFAGWLKALDALRELKPLHVVAGHGPVGNEASITATREYLVALNAAVTQVVNKGVSLADASGEAALPVYETWDQYSVIHGPNVHRSYLELERKLFEAPEK